MKILAICLFVFLVGGRQEAAAQSKKYCERMGPEHLGDYAQANPTCPPTLKKGSKCTVACKPGYVDANGKPSFKVTCKKQKNGYLDWDLKGGKLKCQPPKYPLCQPEHTYLKNGKIGNGKGCTNKNKIGSICTFTCDYKYDLKDFGSEKKKIKCEAASGGKAEWDDDAPTCSPILCAVLGDPSHGKVNCESGQSGRMLGAKCSYKCDKDYDLVENDSGPGLSTRCIEDDDEFDEVGKWNKDAATCNPIVCQPPKGKPENGKKECTEENRLHSVCTFRCDPTYDLKGTKEDTKESVCKEDGNKYDALGEWSGSDAVCIPITCIPEHSRPDNGDVKCTRRNRLGSDCTFECDKPYELVGKEVSSCRDQKHDGDEIAEWTSKAPICVLGECVDQSYDEKTLVRECKPDDSFPVGTKCEYTCKKEGQYMTTHDDVLITEKILSTECQDDKTWTKKPPVCRPITCRILKTPENGFPPSCTKGNRYDSTCTFDCKNGFELSHKDDLLCEDDGDGNKVGKWNHPEPECEDMMCDDFEPVPKYGHLEYTNENYVGSVGTLHCDRGYTIKNHENVTCLAPGEGKKQPDWNRHKQVCCVKCEFNPNIRIGMVIDKTAAQNEREWQDVHSFVDTLTQNLEQGGMNINFGLALYDTAVDTGNSMDLTKINDWEDAAAIAETVKEMPYGGSASNTGAALEYAKENLFASEDGEEPFMIVVMGAKSGDDVVKISKEIRDKDIHVLAASFQYPDHSGPRVIAADKDNVFHVKAWADINTVAARITALSKQYGCSPVSTSKGCP